VTTTSSLSSTGKQFFDVGSLGQTELWSMMLLANLSCVKHWN
jgi:hypothetical protein